MPCKDAMITDVAKASPSQTVQNIMDMFESRRFNSIPVIDDENRVVGMFSVRSVLQNLLPVSARIQGGVDNLDFLSESEAGVAKKLRKLCLLTVGEVMEKNPPTVHPHTPAWEAVRLMAERGSPILVVEQNTRVLLGLISTQSLLARMQNVLREVEKEEGNNDISEK